MCLRASEACLTFGEMAAVNMSAALDTAEAFGVPRPQAAPLLAACAEGIVMGQSDRRKDER
jgi:hypothetical protein